jgi:hypothetical protein
MSLKREEPEAGRKLSTQAVSVLTAGIRALLYQLQALYLRTPVKLFRPLRFDYLAYVRELAHRHHNLNAKPYSVRTHSSLAMLVSVVRHEGWRFIPEQVLPPLLANLATGLILYATYLTALDRFAGVSGRGGRGSGGGDRFYSPYDTFRAGAVAGAAQLLAAAPVDAIYTRLSAAEMLGDKGRNLWVYGLRKLGEIGLVGVFAGYSFLLVKESLGFACYFCAFEMVKTQGYSATNAVLRWFHRVGDRVHAALTWVGVAPPPPPALRDAARTKLTRLLKLLFVLLAGALAALALLAVQYPITKVQKLHLARLEALDIYAQSAPRRRPLVTVYYHLYLDTYHQVRKYKRKLRLPWLQLAYKGFLRNAVTTIPATLVGLLVFEIMRTQMSDEVPLE